MSTKNIVLEFGTCAVMGGSAGDSSPSFKIPLVDLSAVSDIRVYLSELFHRIFIENLHVKSKMCNVLVIEKFLFCRDYRDAILTVLLRDFQVKLAAK
jgi:hypothetical protein